MERTYSSASAEELITEVENALSAVIRDYGHVDDGYCLACDDEPFEALVELRKIFSSRPEWPKDLHKQYLKLLDERDELQAKLDNYEKEE